MNDEKLSIGDAAMTLAASACNRAAELLADGWVKGKLNSGFKGVEEFCIHGALGLALAEIFGDNDECGRVNVCGGYAATTHGRGEVEALATAFIVDTAANKHGYDGNAWKHGSLGAAAFNDAAERKHSEVLDVVQGASQRLWDLVVERDTAPVRDSWVPSKWAEVDVSSEGAQQYLYQTLADA